ncbi:MLO-like protein 12 isoform X1 [Gossypium arboreum]|uniref:MLO-like protein 12 isoform X1 n=1 Tax=Gossypium arboreum TaxID=29729 RepID=UPI0008190E1A|nr:MLO-like protein 12 isoform X1 [Gossypium arboreum]
MANDYKARSLEETPTWAVAVVCFVLVVISIFIEHAIHIVGKWFKKRHKTSLYEALEKVKAELMLMGFISLLLTVFQGPISEICIPAHVANTWHPCNKKTEAEKYSEKSSGRKLVEFSDDDSFYIPRRSLASKSDKCAEQGKVALVSAYGIHQLHIFIFVLAVCHILYCIIIYALGRSKMRKWKAWENETKTIEYQFYNDPERFRFARDTSFGRRHLSFWSRSTLTLWIVCFLRQFFGSVTKVDYLTLRHGFIMAHLAPGNETKFDFQKYIKRSLEDDFKVVVGISPIIWFIAVLFLLAYTHGWYSYLWLPFIPLIIILMVGAKLQVIITKMGLRIQDRGDVVKGAPVVQPGDDLFWFGRPRFLLFLIHVVLFTNAFQLAFFVWSTYEFTMRSCYHEHIEDVIIRVSMGVIIQFLCSYVTLPLYALVTQMGTNMRPTIFNDRVAAALKNWHHTAKKHTKQSRLLHSENTTPFSSRPATPTHGMSPVHILHKHPQRSETYGISSGHSVDHWDLGLFHSPLHSHEINDPIHDHDRTQIEMRDVDTTVQESGSSQMDAETPQTIRTQHEIDIIPSDFSFAKS